MPSPSEVQAAIDLLTTDTGLLHDIVHGPASGAGSTVTLEGGTVPTVLKAISDLTAAIIAGNANGYVATAANSAARALLVPEQVGQLMIQLDTKAIYYAASTTMGDWIFHPVQNAANDAATAVAAVATLTTGLAGKMATADYVGGAAAGIVRTTERLSAIVDFIVANANSSLHTIGVEDGSMTVVPLLQNHRCTALVDGKDWHTSVANTTRSCFGRGTNFAIVNTPGRLISWGAQALAGVLGSGFIGTQSYFPRPVIAKQQPDRTLPGFDPAGIFTGDGQIVRVISQGACTVALTADGLVLVSGAAAQGVKAIFGSGVDKSQHVMMPIYFNNSGVNAVIEKMDVQDSTSATNRSCAVFCDANDNIWLLSKNPENAGYGNALSGEITTPVKLNAGFPSWAGKIVKKIRCDCTGNIYILFTNGELWAGGGDNASGQLGTGSTADILNPVQILTGVDDFDISGQETGTSLAVWVLQGTTLKGAGYNANGQLGQATSGTTNRSSFVTVDTDVNLVRIGGTDNVTLMYRKTTNTWFGLGRNTDGTFGQGASVSINNVPIVLAALTTLISDNGGFEALCVSGFNGKHSACVVCTNGKAFCAGNNTDGVLGCGDTTAHNTWQEVLWSPRDATEKIVDVSSATGPTSGPAFTWRTNHGRILQAGSSEKGFATGITPTAIFDQLIAGPVQLGTV